MAEKEESEHLDVFPIAGLGTIALALSMMIDSSPMVICKAMQMDADNRVRTFGFRMETALLREELKREKEKRGDESPRSAKSASAVRGEEER